MDEHAFGVDITQLQRHYFGDTQAGSIGGHQCSPVANRADVLKELVGFRAAEHDRQFVGNAAARDSVVGPGHFQCYVVEKLGGGDKHIDRLGGKLAFVDHI